MNEDDELRARFGRVGFADEPPAASTAWEDLERGRRHLRRRRVVTLSGGALGVAALATGVALVLPGGGPASGELSVAGSGNGPAAVESPAVPTATSTEAPVPPADEHGYPFPATRQLLLDTAVEHFDPAREHLPAETNGITGGGSGATANVGTKLSWTNAGEDGEGLVQVAVTAAGYVASDDYAFENFTVNIGCDVPETCVEQAVPGTGETVLVAPANPETNQLFAVVYERADGSMVGVAVSDLFGNNSVTPVSAVDITLDQAIAFVTDPDLAVDPDESDDSVGAVTPWGDESSGTIEQGESTTPVD